MNYSKEHRLLPDKVYNFILNDQTNSKKRLVHKKTYTVYTKKQTDLVYRIQEIFYYVYVKSMHHMAGKQKVPNVMIYKIVIEDIRCR